MGHDGSPEMLYKLRLFVHKVSPKVRQVSNTNTLILRQQGESHLQKF